MKKVKVPIKSVFARNLDERNFENFQHKMWKIFMYPKKKSKKSLKFCRLGCKKSRYFSKATYTFFTNVCSTIFTVFLYFPKFKILKKSVSVSYFQFKLLLKYFMGHICANCPI